MEGTTLIWGIIRDLFRIAQVQRKASARAQLGPVGLGVLNLAAQAPARPSAAAAELDVPAQSITRAVGELMTAGLVRRVGDEADGRSYVIELTDAGQKTRAEFVAKLTTQFSDLLADWSPEEIDTFAAQLNRLLTALTPDAPKPVSEPSHNPWRTTKSATGHKSRSESS